MEAQELLRFYPKEEIIRMMNDIAYNKSNNNVGSNMARYGGSMSKYQQAGSVKKSNWEIIE
jgi:hypothetical protein